MKVKIFALDKAQRGHHCLNWLKIMNRLLLIDRFDKNYIFAFRQHPNNNSRKKVFIFGSVVEEDISWAKWVV